MAKGHLSTKKPGQRLRPAAPLPNPTESSPPKKAKGKKTLVRKSADAARGLDKMKEEESEGSEEEGNEMFNVVSKPFQGAMLCFTGVKDKPKLMAMAADMGATSDFALTDTVTHLIASDFVSEKYKVALTLGLPILTADWITSSHAIWIQGGEVDIAQSIEYHRLRPFKDLCVCLTNFERGPARDKLTAAITSSSGTVLNSLNNSTTHLVFPSSNTSGAKIKWATSKNAGIIRGLISQNASEPPMMDFDGSVVGTEGDQGKHREVRIVREEWIWDCVRSGGRWHEAEYSIDQKKEDIKPKGKHRHVPKSDLARQDSTIFRTAGDDDPVEPVRPNGDTMASSRSKADDRPEAARLKPKKRKWGVSDLSDTSIVPALLSGLDEDMPDVSDIGRRPQSTSKSLPNSASTTIRPGSHATTLTSRLSTISRSSSFSAAPSITTTIASSVASTTAALAQTTSNLHLNKSDQRQTRPPHPLAAGSSFLLDNPSATQSSTGTVTSFPFKGLRFLLRLGTGPLTREIQKCVGRLGGEILNEEEVARGGEDGHVDWVVSKLAKGTRSLEPAPTGAQVVTQHWIETCYREDRIVPVDDSVAYRPLTVEMPIPGADAICICPTGFRLADRLALKNLVKAAGGSADDFFSNTKTTHLICSPSDVSGAKYERSLEWELPTVSPEWVYEMARTGVIPELDGYRLGASVADDKLDRTAAFKAASNSNTTTTSISNLSSTRTSRNRSDPTTVNTSTLHPGPLAKPTPLSSVPTLVDEPAVLRSPSSKSNARPLTHSTSSTSNIPPSRSDFSSSKQPLSPGARSMSPSSLKLPPPDRKGQTTEKPTMTSRPKKPVKSEFKLTSEIKALIDEADTSTSDTSALISPELTDEKPAKRKRILGRPASNRLSTTPSRSNLSSDNLLANTSFSSARISTSPIQNMAPALQHDFLPSASYCPNSPPSSDHTDGYADESLRVVYHDAVAARERERLIRRMKGERLSDDEEEEKELVETQPEQMIVDLCTQASTKGKGGGRGKSKVVESLAGEESLERRRSGRLRK